MAKWECTEKPMQSEHRRADTRYIDKEWATQCLHAGERWEQQYFWTSSTPIFNSTTFFYDSAQDLDDRVYYRKPGYVYSRGGSPTNTALERALSTLEGAEVTHVCSSGMAASHLALLTAGAGKDGLIRFLDALQLILPATTLGDIYSLIVNPARTTHHWLGEQELASIGISPGTFRMSVGIEDVEDLKEDLDQALKACQRNMTTNGD